MAKEKDIEDEIMDKKDAEHTIVSRFSSRISLPRYTSLFRGRNNSLQDYLDTRTDLYPENQTDQTHALSLAEQIKRGQIDGSMLNESETSGEIVESTLPFYNREEFSMQEHDFKERIKSNYDSALAKRRDEEAIKQSEMLKQQSDNFKTSETSVSEAED